MQDYKYLLERQIGEEIVEHKKVKKSPRKFLYIFLVFIILSIIGGSFYIYKKKKIKMFKISKFEIVGIENSSKDKILSILNKNKNKPLKDIYEKLVKVKWVDDVILRRKFPSMLVVKVIEKEPESLLQFHGKLYLIDKNGEIIDKYESRFYRRDFIIFQIKGDKLTKENKEKISQILEVLKGYSFIKDISDITINGDELNIILTEPRLKLFISMENFKNEIYKINILKRLADTEDVKKSAVAKLDYKNRIYLSRSE